MTPDRLDPAVLADRASWIRTMLAGIRSLPLHDFETFRGDPRNVAAAESYLRRAIEALVDLGRHLLRKRFAVAVSEYRAVPAALGSAGVLPDNRTREFTRICGYRNRLVHFYHAIDERELYTICVNHADEIEKLLNEILHWIDAHPEDEQG